VEDIKTPLSPIDRSSKQKINKEILELNDIIDQIDYFENLCSNKLENLEEMNKFLDTYDHPKLNQEDINHLTRSITHNETGAAIESPKKEKSRT
jgi:uncharacterized protein YbaP (TraB family)